MVTRYIYTYIVVGPTYPQVRTGICILQMVLQVWLHSTPLVKIHDGYSNLTALIVNDPSLYDWQKKSKVIITNNWNQLSFFKKRQYIRWISCLYILSHSIWWKNFSNFKGMHGIISWGIPNCSRLLFYFLTYFFLLVRRHYNDSKMISLGYDIINFKAISYRINLK